MTKEEIRQKRIRRIEELVGREGLIKWQKLTAILSYETGASVSKCDEYVKILVMAEVLETEDGFVSLKGKKQPSTDSA